MQSPIIDGMRVHHNARPRTGLGGKPPCDRMGLVIEGDNKRVTLIQSAERARMERRVKMMRRNSSKKAGIATKPQRVKKPANVGHVKHLEHRRAPGRLRAKSRAATKCPFHYRSSSAKTEPDCQPIPAWMER